MEERDKGPTDWALLGCGHPGPLAPKHSAIKRKASLPHPQPSFPHSFLFLLRQNPTSALTATTCSRKSAESFWSASVECEMVRW